MLKQLDGWNEKETVEYYTNNRNTYSDLYDSEKYFITKEFISQIDSVLDVGCSVGGISNIFREFNESIIYTGIDVSENAILRAKEISSNKNSSFYCYDGKSEFPLNTTKYDLVFSSGVMHLVDNYKDLLKQMIERTNKYLLVDFRLTKNDTYVGKFYFSFSDKKEATNFTNYHVLNFQKLMNIFTSYKELSNINIFGYKGNASNMSEGIDDVYMFFFLIEKNNNINNNLKINFESKEMQYLFLDEK